MGMGEQKDGMAGEMAHQVLEAAGSQEGMSLLQMAGGGPHEGFAAAGHQKALLPEGPETGLGGHLTGQGIFLLHPGHHKGYQGAAVVEGDRHFLSAYGLKEGHQFRILGGQDALQDSGRIGQDAGSCGRAVQHQHGGGVRRDGPQERPVIGEGCRIVVVPRGGVRIEFHNGNGDACQKQGHCDKGNYGATFRHIMQR